MIERYTRPEMAEIWSDERRYRSWVRIEVAVCRALAARGEIPQAAFHAIEERESQGPEVAAHYRLGPLRTHLNASVFVQYAG